MIFCFVGVKNWTDWSFLNSGHTTPFNALIAVFYAAKRSSF